MCSLRGQGKRVDGAVSDRRLLEDEIREDSNGKQYKDCIK